MSPAWCQDLLSKKAALAVASAKSPGKVLKKYRVHEHTPETGVGGSGGSGPPGDLPRLNLIDSFNKTDAFIQNENKHRTNESCFCTQGITGKVVVCYYKGTGRYAIGHPWSTKQVFINPEFTEFPCFFRGNVFSKHRENFKRSYDKDFIVI